MSGSINNLEVQYKLLLEASTGDMEELAAANDCIEEYNEQFADKEKEIIEYQAMLRQLRNQITEIVNLDSIKGIQAEIDINRILSGDKFDTTESELETDDDTFHCSGCGCAYELAEYNDVSQQCVHCDRECEYARKGQSMVNWYNFPCQRYKEKLVREYRSFGKVF
tara:strand:- start:970 stop:1467 length:498 start_codon:yes stop_codon:yes gene_type:complete